MTKQQILDAIRATAAENGGTPLGWRRFSDATGIGEAHWLGKHWARWSDAVREAGFVPNKLRGLTYTDADLLAKWARLARDIGSLPSANDFRMRDRTDPDYPNAKVFDRLGTKAEQVQKVLEFCRATEGWDDVARLCEAYKPPQDSSRATDDAQEGIVYLAKSGRHYKIGRSNALGRRVYELSIQLPERLKLVHAIRTDDPTGIEAYWHARFEAKRLNGEWFDLEASDIEAFKRRKKFM